MIPAVARNTYHGLGRVPQVLLLAVFLTACRDTTAPETRTSIRVLAGDAQFGTTDAFLSDVLQAEVTDPATGRPRQGVVVEWRVETGGASVTPPAATTDSRGVATTQVRLGPSLGTARIRASTDDQVGGDAVFTATAVLPPVIAAVAPTSADAGDTVTINGANFHASAGVLFDGLAGTVVTVSSDRIRVIVPPCVGTRATAVEVTTGSVTSEPATLQTTAAGGSPILLARGEVRRFSTAAEMRCLRLHEPAGAGWLLIAQNAAAVQGPVMPFQLAAIGLAPPVMAARQDAHATEFASAWELALRARERALPPAGADDIAVAPGALQGAPVIPDVGDRRTFNTLDDASRTVKITAEVKAVTSRAILYQDIAAADIFTHADYERFGELFDDPIYSTATSVFGTPGDIDNNQRVIVVFTPQVNALTLRGSGSYIAGYFYACDLVSRSRCSASNGGEIFYSMVPDPAGTFSDPQSASSVLRSVPPVLAHELQHMIAFGRRGGTLDDLWLSEALAHSAEDMVGQVLLARGDQATAAEFLAQNHSNARRFLTSVAETGLVDVVSPGTIALRGAGWLFVRYLRSHFGGDAVLANLASTSLTGTANVVAVTGKAWPVLLSDFGVALYADNAPELAGVSVEPRYTFPDIDIRATLSPAGNYPLAIRYFNFTDFTLSGALATGAQHYTYVQADGSGKALNLGYAGAYGGAFVSGSVPQLTLLRVR